MRCRLYILLLALAGAPLTSLGQASNAGIVQGLWYDQETFFVGDAVRVYVAVRNNSGADLSGTIEFFVNGERIERNNIDALDGRIVESWGDWEPQYGTSTISATLSRTEISSTASGTEAVTVTSALAEDTIFVDRDTDGDNIGNVTDEDDDGDGIVDTEDTEPLVFNRPTQRTTSEDVSADTTGENEIDSDTEIRSDASDDSEPVGLEQFLTPSRADSALENLTDSINESKRRLDEYREQRATASENTAEAGADPSPSQTIASSSGTTSPDGFGTITRTQSSETKNTGWLDTIWQFIATAASMVYTLILALLSWILGNPSLVQLLLLFIILYTIYRLAKKFGSRPS